MLALSREYRRPLPSLGSLMMPEPSGMSESASWAIAFLFWSIGAGIILAAGMIPLAVIGSVCIGIILLVFVNRTSNTHPYMVVLSCTDHDAEVKAREFLAKNVTRTTTKSKSAVKGAIELNIEVRLKEDDTDFINILSEMPGVNSAVIVSYNGDYMG